MLMATVMAILVGAGFAIGDMIMIIGGGVVGAGCLLFASGILEEE